MHESSTDRTITLDEKTYQRLAKAKKEGESFSDVVNRLSEPKVSALQRRGEKEIATSDERKVLVRIVQSKCMGAESCVVVAPTVFSLDVRQLGSFRRDSEPLGMRDVEERTIDTETVVLAAKSCPYKAIYVKDAETKEELAGDPW